VSASWHQIQLGKANNCAGRRRTESGPRCTVAGCHFWLRPPADPSPDVPADLLVADPTPLVPRSWLLAALRLALGAGYRPPVNREIAPIHQQLVGGSGLAVSLVNNYCEIAAIPRDMATTTDIRAGPLKKQCRLRLASRHEIQGNSCTPKTGHKAKSNKRAPEQRRRRWAQNIIQRIFGRWRDGDREVFLLLIYATLCCY
jgi:hypothetical protein